MTLLCAGACTFLRVGRSARAMTVALFKVRLAANAAADTLVSVKDCLRICMLACLHAHNSLHCMAKLQDLLQMATLWWPAGSVMSHVVLLLYCASLKTTKLVVNYVQSLSLLNSREMAGSGFVH